MISFICTICKIPRKILKNGNVIEKRDFTIYKQISYMVVTCRVVEENLSGITVQIDLFEYRKLFEDLTNKFFIKKSGNQEFEKKIGSGYFAGNVFLTIKTYNGFGLQKS